MRSDFIFDKNISNVPFFPLAYFQAKYNPDFTLEDSCLSGQGCDFSYSSISQGFGLPVWVGQKDMIILAETLESDRLGFNSQNITLNNVGLLGAWISQPSSQWQTGLFLYAYDGFDEDDEIQATGGVIFGGGGRYRHHSNLHSYWGLVRLDDKMQDLVMYPYIGFDWFIGKTLSVSALIPWPSISYSPDTDTIYRFGASLSGSDWLLNDENKLVSHSLGIVDFGMFYEKRLSGMFWLETGLGYSGYSRLSISSDDDLEFESKLEPSPFLRLSLNLRPE